MPPTSRLDPRLLPQVGVTLPALTPRTLGHPLAPVTGPAVTAAGIPAPMRAPNRGGFAGLLDHMMPMTNDGGLLGLHDLDAAQAQGLLGAGMAVLQNSGWKSTPGTMGQALGDALQGMQQGYQGAIGGRLQMAQMAEQRRLEQEDRARAVETQQRLQASRAQLGAMMQPQPGEDRAAFIARLRTAYGQAVASGDTQTATSIGQYLMSQDDSAKPPTLERSDLGDRVEYIDPRTNQVVRTAQKGAPPIDPELRASRVDQTTRFNAQVRDQIIGDFNQNTRELQVAAQGYGVITAATKDITSASPISLLYAYAKVLDPGSVVKEGEIATLQRLGALDQRIANRIEQIRTGKMNPTTLNDIVAESKKIMRERQKSFNEYKDKAITRGALDHIDMGSILPDPYSIYDLSEPAPTRAATPALQKFQRYSNPGFSGNPAAAPAAPPPLQPVPRFVNPTLHR